MKTLKEELTEPLYVEDGGTNTPQAILSAAIS